MNDEMLPEHTSDKFEKWFPYIYALAIYLFCGISWNLEPDTGWDFGWDFNWSQIIGLFGVWSYFTFKKIFTLISPQSDEHDGIYARTWIIFVLGWFMMLGHAGVSQDFNRTSFNLERLNEAMRDTCYGTDDKIAESIKAGDNTPCKTFSKLKISAPLSTSTWLSPWVWYQKREIWQ